MELIPLEIEGAWLATSPVWSDERGFFREWFKSDEVTAKTGIDFSVAQANVSKSNRGVLRGIHYSLAPGGQAKWVTCVSGAIMDMVVDIRPDSPTFKKYVPIDLKGGEGKAVLIGEGLGHGFIALEDSVVSYLLTSPYSPSNEFEIYPLDKQLDINWEIQSIGGMGHIWSPKDSQAPTLQERINDGKIPYLNK